MQVKEKIENYLDDVKCLAIGGHIQPDGDCIGAVFGLYAYIRKNYPEIAATLYLETVPERFRYLRYIENVASEPDEEAVYDLYIQLDSGSEDRMGSFAKCFQNSKRTISIDHHISNTKYADVNIVYPEKSSASELLFEMLDCDKIDVDVASAIYTGIVCDSGAFKYPNTTARTMEIAGILMEKGIPFTKIADDAFYSRTFVQNQILGRALMESIVFFDGKCIVSVIRRSTMKFYEIENSDLEGIVENLRTTKGIECAIFMYEIGELEYKVSMRSNEIVDVSKIAEYFGGGGHVRAAGFTLHGSMHDVINNISQQIEIQLA